MVDEIIGRLARRDLALSLVWAVLSFASRGWQGINYDPTAVQNERVVCGHAASAVDPLPGREDVIAA